MEVLGLWPRFWMAAAKTSALLARAMGQRDSARHTAPVRGPERAPVFVLIHSPLVGPTTWLPVARELERRGRDAVLPSLLGVAEAEVPQWRHIPEAVRDATAATAKPVVLVGHSGAGLLLPVIADALTTEVVGLIFVDSDLPPVSGNLDLVPPEFMAQLRALAVGGVLPPWSNWFGEDTMRELVPDNLVRASLENEMPLLPLSYFEASVALPDDWDARPSAYLLLTSDSYRESAADARGRGWTVAEISGSQHLAVTTEPIDVTGALLELESALLQPS
jgi:pimeloyl-ACP methyl ester carboxylesterase